jgi:GntR family transcriptional regulator
VTSSDEDTRVRAGVLRYVREAVAGNHPLLGEIELSRQLSTSRQQVRHALSALERQGIVRRRQGASTIVDPIALRMSVRLEEQSEHEDLLSRLGYQPSVEVLESGLTPLPPDLAPLLTTDASDAAFRVVKRWSADDQPAMLAVNHVALPPGMVGDLNPADSVFAIAERAWGESIVWEVATPGVCLLSASEAGLLDLPIGAPTLTIEIIGTTVTGRRTFHAFEWHNPAVVTYAFVRTVRPPWSTAYQPS